MVLRGTERIGTGPIFASTGRLIELNIADSVVVGEGGVFVSSAISCYQPWPNFGSFSEFRGPILPDPLHPEEKFDPVFRVFRVVRG